MKKKKFTYKNQETIFYSRRLNRRQFRTEIDFVNVEITLF